MIEKNRGKEQPSTESSVQQRVKQLERTCLILAVCICFQAICSIGLLVSYKRLVRINAQYTEIVALLSERIDGIESIVTRVFAGLDESNQLLEQIDL